MKQESLQYIFATWGESYRARYPRLTPVEHKAMRAISICRTEEMGGRVEQCDTCGKRIVLYNSCRNRHCPQCQNMKKEKWIMDRKSEIFPFTYFHVVFTLPDSLNAIVFRNKIITYNLMFRSCRETLLSVCSEEKYFGADIGFFAILHTWGQRLNPHPHLHCVVPGGGYSPSRGRWVRSPDSYLVPVKVLQSRFRGIFLAALKKLHADGALFLDGTCYEDPLAFGRYIDSLFELTWVVYLKESFHDRSSVIEYLARYTHKTAIANHRIISVHNKTVSFSWRDYRDENRQKIESLNVHAFMRRFLLHVVPYRFVRIRYFGLLAHRNKKKALMTCLAFYQLEGKTHLHLFDWRTMYAMTTGKDCLLCPACGNGKLIIVEIIRPSWNSSPPR
jgi:hypothetical protein